MATLYDVLDNLFRKESIENILNNLEKIIEREFNNVEGMNYEMEWEVRSTINDKNIFTLCIKIKNFYVLSQNKGYKEIVYRQFKKSLSDFF